MLSSAFAVHLAARRTESPQASQFLPDTPLWSVEVSAAPVGAPVIGSDQLLLALNTDEIEAHHLTDGRLLWRLPLPLDQPLAIDGERIAAASNGELRVLAGADGKPIWNHPTGKLAAPLLAVGGWIIAATEQQLIAFRADNGQEVWRQESPGQTERATIEGDTLFVPQSNGVIRALDLTTGAEKWRTQLGGAPTEILALPDRIYVGSADKHFYCLHASTGRLDWAPVAVGAPLRGRPAADDRHVYVGAMDNQLRAYDRRTGALKWHVDARFRPTVGPTVIGPIVVLSAKAALELRAWAVRTGTPAGQLSFGDGLVEPVTLAQSGPRIVMAAVTGGLNEKYRLVLYGPPIPSIDAAPLTVLPGVPVTIRLPGR